MTMYERHMTHAGADRFYNYETPIPPKVYDGPPPMILLQDANSGDYLWVCECGKQGISSTREWAHSDVNRHRQAE